jgi:hypothetical protein
MRIEPEQLLANLLGLVAAPIGESGIGRQHQKPIAHLLLSLGIITASELPVGADGFFGACHAFLFSLIASVCQQKSEVRDQNDDNRSTRAA